MKKLTIEAFVWAILSAVLLAALSQAGERVMRPEFGIGLKATKAKKAPAAVSPTPGPAPATGPGGEEIFTDELGSIPPAPATEEESGWTRFGDWIRGKRPSADDDETAPTGDTRIKGKKILEN